MVAPALNDAAFTLVEMIVVIIIIGIFAGIALPRALSNSGRRLDAETQTVQRLMSIAAERETLAGEPIALAYDDSTATFRILVRRIGSAYVTRRGSSSSANAAPQIDWVNDPLVLPVTLTETKLANAWLDGRPLARRGWQVTFLPSEARPAIALQIEAKSPSLDSGAAAAWQIVLGSDDPTATRATVRTGGGAPPLGNSRAIDLDATGRGQKSW